MTDLRETRWLLEIIADYAKDIESGVADPTPPTAIVEAIAELVRRGDTLVWATDLSAIFDLVREHPQMSGSDRDYELLRVLARLEIAAGDPL